MRTRRACWSRGEAASQEGTRLIIAEKYVRCIAYILCLTVDNERGMSVALITLRIHRTMRRVRKNYMQHIRGWGLGSMQLPH